jgi:hypothetical protein
MSQVWISKEELEALTKGIIGLSVSHAWCGFGSAIFLEIGELHRKSGENNPKGEATVMLEWSWRVERLRSIWFGSFSGDRKIKNGLAKLKGLKVLGVTVEGRLPELVIRLSGNTWVHSFNTVESQPEWCLFLPSGGWVDSHIGKLRRTIDSDGAG